MTLSDKLTEQKAQFVAKAPAEVATVFDAGVAALEASGLASRALGLGAVAPSFTLQGATGSAVSLESLLASGPLVLTFYRGGWCPYCNLELRALQGVLGDLTDAGASLVAISPQIPDESLSTAEKAELDFEVLSDPDNELARRFGIVFTIDDATKEIYAKSNHPIERVNGSGSWELPIPATYIIDRDGTIAYAFVDPDYRKRAEPADILASLLGLATGDGS